MSYAKLKVQYFKAKTEWHQALQCKDDKKFGEMIARLQIAQATLKNIIRVPSKTAKLCLPPLFSIHGRFHGSEEGEIEA